MLLLDTSVISETNRGHRRTLAATAKVHDLTLVTRNVRAVEGLDVRVLNPFS